MDVFQHESVCMGLARGRWGPVLVRPYRSGVLETRAGLCDDAAVVSRMQMYAKGKGLKRERAQEGLFRISD